MVFIDNKVTNKKLVPPTPLPNHRTTSNKNTTRHRRPEQRTLRSIAPDLPVPSLPDVGRNAFGVRLPGGCHVQGPCTEFSLSPGPVIEKIITHAPFQRRMKGIPVLCVFDVRAKNNRISFAGDLDLPDIEAELPGQAHRL